MIPVLSTVVLAYERDVVLARQRARELASLLGYDVQDQTRIATAVSEIARNAFEYANGGTVSFRIEGVTRPQLLQIEIVDRGPGIPDLPAVLEGRYRSLNGMGAGITGARRLVDRFEIESEAGTGTRVVLKKLLPRDRALVDNVANAALMAELARRQPRDPIQEVRLQNQELLRALDENRRRQEELKDLNHELEDTNRGVVALYAELDEKADHLRRADDIKTRFISNMSHEFRTPVNSIQALARLLRSQADGPLNSEQERQVEFIERAAEDLSELVNDLLDLAKVEAGKVEMRPTEFELERMFGALRGMLRPLLVNESVDLVFDDPTDIPALYTDEGKVSQILRNFISNALKFTEEGEVRVSARLTEGGRVVALSVSDTGIGIDPADHERIFHEFAQIESPIQRRVRGTGLGLPLCRKLAALLGGTVSVSSRIGHGSTFIAEIPVIYEAAPSPARVHTLDPARIPVLAIEDNVEQLLLFEKFVSGSHYQIVSTRSLRQAREALVQARPRAILLDILLRGEDTWEFLTDLKRSHETRSIPVAVITTVEDRQKGLALGADEYFIKPIDRQELLQLLTRLVAPQTMKRILIVDDDAVARYILRRHLHAPHRVIEEASDGPTAIARAVESPPDVICLDLSMPGVTGYEVLRRLRQDPRTHAIPVLVVSSMRIDDEERRALLPDVRAILSKDDLSEERVAIGNRSGSAAGGVMNGERELLLVVDDTETARYTKARALRAAGFDVLEAATGQDALRIARELGPRLVVLDVRLPDINGWEVCRRLKTELSVLVLQVSATFVTDADTVRALEAGADSCLTEPLDGMVLVATVRALLRVRHAEDALRETLARELAAREAADAANRAKDAFLATLSHELRTPMSAILTWAVVLRDQRLDAEQRLRAADAIVRNANLQVRLIDDLLDVSRVVSGKMRLELGPVALTEVVAAAIDFIRPAADAKSLQISTRVEPGLGLLYGDASRLQQVVWNLLSNAVKFTPQGGSIAVHLRAAGPDAEIEVRDTGRGIEPEFLPFIFDRFRQADSSATRLSGGLGLGLAIVRHLVELHGGSVEAESPGLDQGTTFRVRLPFPANRPRAEFARSIEWSPSAGASLVGVGVLLVDDERDSRDAVAMFLRGAGAEVRTAGSVDEAVQAIEAQSPDIVVSDIAMPDKDGFALLEWLRNHASEAGGTVPAIALTAFGGPREVEQILGAGFHAYLRKPIEPADLVGTIHQIANPAPDATPNVS